MIEIIRPFRPRRIRIVAFDFDGTLSLLRAGWQQIMVDLMFEVLQSIRPESQGEIYNPETSGNRKSRIPGAHPGTGTNPELKTRNEKSDQAGSLRAGLREMVDQSTGLQTIDQMLMLAKLAQDREGKLLTPHDLRENAIRYKQIFLERLLRHASDRFASIRSGRSPACRFLVAGAQEFLQWLSSYGSALYLISGTDQQEVVNEANLLGIGQFFDGRIFGGLDNAGEFTKLDTIRRLLSSYGTFSEAMVAFGDGIMDIRSTKEAGALAVGVASDEEKGQAVNPIKQRQLIAAGADAIVGDYGNYQDWVGRIFESGI